MKPFTAFWRLKGYYLKWCTVACKFTDAYALWIKDKELSPHTSKSLEINVFLSHVSELLVSQGRDKGMRQLLLSRI